MAVPYKLEVTDDIAANFDLFHAVDRAIAVRKMRTRRLKQADALARLAKKEQAKKATNPFLPLLPALAFCNLCIAALNIF